MNYLFSFNQFILEAKQKALEDILEVRVGEKTLNFQVRDLINWVREEGYEIERINVRSIKTYFEDTESEIYVTLDGKDKKFRDLTAKEIKMWKDLEVKRIQQAKLNYPVILTKAPGDKKWFPLDGNHRIEKAKKEGRRTVKAYLIPYNQLDRIPKA